MARLSHPMNECICGSTGTSAAIRLESGTTSALLRSRRRFALGAPEVRKRQSFGEGLHNIHHAYPTSARMKAEFPVEVNGAAILRRLVLYYGRSVSEVPPAYTARGARVSWAGALRIES